MRALIKDKPVRGATLTDLPLPEIGEEDLLVRVQAAFGKAGEGRANPESMLDALRIAVRFAAPA